MRHLTQDVGRDEALDVLIIDSFQETFTCGTITRISSNSVNQTIGIEEDRSAGWDVIKRHGSPIALHPGR